MIAKPDIQGPTADASTWWDYIAISASALAGIAFLVGLVMLWSNAKRGQQVIVSALSVLVGAQIMLFIGAHLVWISFVILFVGLGSVGYRHKKKIADYWDGPTDAIPARGHG